MPNPTRSLSLAAALSSALLAAAPASAGDTWDPFNQLDHGTPAKKKPPAAKPDDTTGAPLPPSDGPASANSGANTPYSDFVPPPAAPNTAAGQPLPPPLDERSRGVERGELAPIIANDGSGLPYELWRGLDLNALEGQLARLDIPPRSPAVHNLWHRLITSNVTPPDGAANNGRFDTLRAEALYRSGLLIEAGKAISADGAPSSDTVRTELASRIEIGLGNTEKGCELIKSIATRKSELPKPLHSEALLISGLCAAASGNPAAAGLVADLAREEKSDDVAGIAILDAVAAGNKSPVRGLKSVSLLVYRVLALGGGIDPKDVIEHGEPALLASLAADSQTAPSLRLAAAEAAARVNALKPGALAALYRELGPQPSTEALLATAPATTTEDPASRRAALFKSAEAERTPYKKVRIMRALLDDARRAGLYLQTLNLLAKPADAIQPVPEIGWFAESGVEIGLASGNIERARQWTALGGSVPADNGLKQWLSLIDLADPALKGDRGRNLPALEALATHGRLPPDLLHRLATVLDANDINVPIPLWEAASRSPQPAGGYLPETGVLTGLQDASKKKEFGHTVLLVMRSLGPNGAEGANLIALGDSIRALHRAGLESDARRLSIEALFAAWPRHAAN